MDNYTTIYCKVVNFIFLYSVVCTTSTGCIFGGSGLGSKRDQTIPGKEAGNEILTSILSKSCVDEHMQDQVINSLFYYKIKISSKQLIISFP